MSVLSRYEGKRIKLITDDGTEFTGTAEVYPSGYGLHVFNRAEESILIENTHIFHSSIRKIEELSRDTTPVIPARQFDNLIGDLLDGSYWIVDVLPEQVPADADGQYFSVEQYYLQPKRIHILRRRFAEILLRLNCYDDMAVSFDSCESWEKNPDPETFADRLVCLSGNDFLRAVFEAQKTMVDIEHDDTYMTVYNPPPEFLNRLRMLASAEGLFVWNPQDFENNS